MERSVTVTYTYDWDAQGNPLTVPVIPENVYWLPDKKGDPVMQLVAFPGPCPVFDPETERKASRNPLGQTRRWVFLTSTLKDAA
jgi:hypothetical protein